jgi:hypothetical protein
MSYARWLLEKLNIGKVRTWEMAKLKPSKTGLAVTLWADEAGDLRNTHNKSLRAKFQKFKTNDMSRSNLVDITLENNPKIHPENFKTDLTPKEINQIKTYVSRYWKYIAKLSNSDYDIEDYYNEIRNL